MKHQINFHKAKDLEGTAKHVKNVEIFPLIAFLQ